MPLAFPSNSMRSCIFIDGENLRHSLIDLFRHEFDPTEYLPKRARWSEFFDHLAVQSYGSTRLRTYWYVVQHIDFWPWRLPERQPETLVKVLAKHPPFADELKAAGQARDEVIRRMVDVLARERQRMEGRFKGWERIQDGIAGAHEAVEFRRAGAIPYDLFLRQFGKEKAVDVKLAVDLLQLADIYETAIIVSGDGDYVPAVQAVKDRGRRVVNVAFKTRDGKLLPGGARRLNQITDAVQEVEYAEMKGFMMPDLQHVQGRSSR